MTVQLVRKVRAGAPAPDSGYQVPVDTRHAPFTFADGQEHAPTRRDFDVRWIVVGLVLFAAGLGAFLHFATR